MNSMCVDSRGRVRAGWLSSNLLWHFQHLLPTAVLKLMDTLSFNRTCKQLGSAGLGWLAQNPRHSAAIVCAFQLLSSEHHDEYEHAINWNELRFEHGRLAVDGSPYDCGEIRAKLAMVWIHWIRLPFSTLFAFCWRLQQMCMNNVWRRKLAFTVMWKLKATKCYMSRQANVIFIMRTARMPNRLLHFPLYNW